jgi:hypothetical protein
MLSVPPAFSVPPHLRYGRGDELHVWFTDPPGAIVQMAKPQRGTVEQARWLVGPGFQLLRERFPEAAKLILVLDYSHMTGRDTAARTVMVDSAGAVAQFFSGVFIVPPLQASVVYRMMLRAAAVLVSALGTPIEIVESLTAVMADQALQLTTAVPAR